MPKRLWDKGEPLDAAMHELTVGNDPALDKALVRFDCIGSAAHARMLASVGLLAPEESASLIAALRAIAAKDDFTIPPELEDVHTAIEGYLTAKLGEAGERIHTGRSRNDQVILAVRLWMRDRAVVWLEGLGELCELLLKRYDELKSIPMPGYTHLQPAMPSSVGLWLQAWVEGCLDLMREGLAVLDLLDANPLGSAAGFGASLPLDRALVAKLLGFSRVQRSVIDVQDSRGRHELRLLNWGAGIASLFEKLACDVSLFCTREFGFFSLPPELTTGSSIMPQKRNPDLVELLRGRAGRVRAAAAEMAWVTAKLPSSYHRDLQFTKEPLFRGSTDVDAVLRSVSLVIGGLQIHADRLAAAMHNDLYATYDVYRQVREGVPFREAYRATSARVGNQQFDAASLAEDFKLIADAADADVAAASGELADLYAKSVAWRQWLEAVEEGIFSL